MNTQVTSLMSGLSQSFEALAITANVATYPIQTTPLQLVCGNDRYLGASPPLVQFPYAPDSSAQKAFWATGSENFMGSAIAGRLSLFQNTIDAAYQKVIDEAGDVDSLDGLAQAIYHLKKGNKTDAMTALTNMTALDSTDPLTSAALYEVVIEIARTIQAEWGKTTAGNSPMDREGLSYMESFIPRQHSRALDFWKATGYVDAKSPDTSDLDAKIALNLAMLHAYHAGEGEPTAAYALRSGQILAGEDKPLEAGASFLQGALWYTSFVTDPDFHEFETVYQILLELEDAWTQDYTPNLPGADDAMESTDAIAPQMSPEVFEGIRDAKIKALEILYRLGVERAKDSYTRTYLNPKHRVEIPESISVEDFASTYTRTWASRINGAVDNRELLSDLGEEMAYGIQHALSRQIAASNPTEWQQWRQVEVHLGYNLLTRIREKMMAGNTPL